MDFNASTGGFIDAVPDEPTHPTASSAATYTWIPNVLSISVLSTDHKNEEIVEGTVVILVMLKTGSCLFDIRNGTPKLKETLDIY